MTDPVRLDAPEPVAPMPLEMALEHLERDGLLCEHARVVLAEYRRLVQRLAQITKVVHLMEISLNQWKPR
jgi:hypothetical protein